MFRASNFSFSIRASTFKLKFGHRGINHPVKNIDSGKIEITSQNHGFAVEMASLPKDVTPTHINLNDNTLAGFRCINHRAFSVQYHPNQVLDHMIVDICLISLLI